MKTLKMLAAGVAAAMAFAAVPAVADEDAQVYEVTLTLKSTLAKKGSTTAVVCDTPSNDTGLYRKQGSVRVRGLIWGCGCPTIADPQKVSDPAATFGYVFWNLTTGKVLDADFGWKILNRIDRTLKKTEGLWTLEGETVGLTGGGFGTVRDTVDKECCSIDNTWITTMSGNCAGWFTMPSTVVGKGKEEVCTKCSLIEGTEDVVAVAPGFSLCDCEEDTEITAVSGTWRLKYNAMLTRKWSTASADASITTIYNFPSYVKAYIDSL